MKGMFLPLGFAAVATLLSPSSPEHSYKQPQLAQTADGVGLTFGSGNTIYFAKSANGGKNFGKPQPVAEVEKLMLGRHRGPRLVFTPQGAIIAAIVTDAKLGLNGALVAWRSGDGGRSWSSPVKINDVPQAAREGLHSLAADGKGRLFAVWLDLRQKGMRLYGSSSTDSGATWSKNGLVYESPDGSICTCCHPTAVFTPEGELAVLFRNDLKGARDLYVANSKDGGQSFGKAEKQGDGTWLLNACPMDGGSMVADNQGRIQTAWRREKSVYTSFNSRVEQKLGEGKDASVALGKAGMYVIWTAPDGIALKTPGKAAAQKLANGGGFPQLLGLANGAVLAAWESGNSIAVQVVQ